MSVSQLDESEREKEFKQLNLHVFQLAFKIKWVFRLTWCRINIWWPSFFFFLFFLVNNFCFIFLFSSWKLEVGTFANTKWKGIYYTSDFDVANKKCKLPESRSNLCWRRASLIQHLSNHCAKTFSSKTFAKVSTLKVACTGLLLYFHKCKF